MMELRPRTGILKVVETAKIKVQEKLGINRQEALFDHQRIELVDGEPALIGRSPDKDPGTKGKFKGKEVTLQVADEHLSRAAVNIEVVATQGHIEAHLKIKNESSSNTVYVGDGKDVVILVPNRETSSIQNQQISKMDIRNMYIDIHSGENTHRLQVKRIGAGSTEGKHSANVSLEYSAPVGLTKREKMPDSRLDSFANRLRSLSNVLKRD